MSAALSIPRFLPRGLALLRREDRHWVTSYGSEADLRDALATSWWLHGAEVQTEVKVPNCGRIDVLVTTPSLVSIIEIKRKITTPGEALAAFQQAYTYFAFQESERFDRVRELLSEAERRQRLDACVVAADIDVDAVAAASRAFRDVDWCSYSIALGRATCGKDEYGQAIVDRDDVRRRLTAARLLVNRLEVAERDLIDVAESNNLADLASAS